MRRRKRRRGEERGKKHQQKCSKQAKLAFFGEFHCCRVGGEGAKIGQNCQFYYYKANISCVLTQKYGEKREKTR